jgi:16S rRNA (uracil1498-N3)-methyltransferase
VTLAAGAAGVTPRNAAAHAFVADLSAPALEPADFHHLTRARRLRPGDVITVGDGAGGWRPVRLDEELEPCGAVVTEPAPAPEVTIAFAPAKGDRPEWVVQKLTELGVDRIVTLRTARGVVRWDHERQERQLERWRRIAREAAAQCRRVWLPTLPPMVDFAVGVAWPDAALAVLGGYRPSLDRPTLLVGPEGGWADDELEAAGRAGLPHVGLGDHVLRAETAAVAAGALLAAERAYRGR